MTAIDEGTRLIADESQSSSFPQVFPQAVNDALWRDLQTRDSAAAAKIERDPDRGCWVWMAASNEHGYGCISRRGLQRLAHRYIYALFLGEIPDGLYLDHICRRPACTYPLHMEPVTPLQNARRGPGNSRKTHCPSGHPYSGDNVRVTAGRRVCVICRRAAGRKWAARHRAGASA